MSTNKLLCSTTTTGNASLCPSLCSTRMLWTRHDGSSTNDASPNDAGMCSSMRPTRMLWTSYDASSTPNDAILPSSMCSTRMLRPTTTTTNASLCSSLCSTRVLWTRNDGSSTNDASPNDGPNDAILSSIMCSTRMLCSTTTTTNASLSTSLCSNGMLCTSHASYATTIMHAIVCTKLLHGKEIDHYNKQKINKQCQNFPYHLQEKLF